MLSILLDTSVDVRFQVCRSDFIVFRFARTFRRTRIGSGRCREGDVEMLPRPVGGRIPNGSPGLNETETVRDPSANSIARSASLPRPEPRTVRPAPSTIANPRAIGEDKISTIAPAFRCRFVHKRFQFAGPSGCRKEVVRTIGPFGRRVNGRLALRKSSSHLLAYRQDLY